MSKERHYKPTKREAGQILRETKIAALKGDSNALLAYSNLQLAEAIRQHQASDKAA